MDDEKALDERKERLAAAIAAAQARLAARRGHEDDSIGALLAGLNDEVDQIVHEDHDAAKRAYDRIEARLAAERIRLEDDAEEEDR
jgi:F0F1-type ATP synthase membrane subunit b/b'